MLQNLNKLNRSLEGVIAVSPLIVTHQSDTDNLQVGNEFSQVEGLWAQFENVMARPEEAGVQEQDEAETAT